MRAIETSVNTKGKRYKVRYRVAGRQASQTFDRLAEAKRFALLLDAFPKQPQRALDALSTEEAQANVPTLDVLAGEHIAHLEGAGAGHRTKSARLWARTWGPRIGSTRADLVTRDLLIDTMGDLARNGRGPGRGYSEKSLKNQRGLIHGVLTRAVDQGDIAHHPGLKLQIPQVTVALDSDDDEAAEMVCLTPSEFAAVYAAMSEHYRAMVRFMVGTGVRWGEVVVLRPEDVNLAGGTVRIRRALKWSPDGKFTIGPPKTKKSRRTIVLPSETVADLREVMAGKPPGAYLFAAAKGGMIQHRTFWSDHWRPALWRAQHCPEHTDPGCLCGSAHPKRCQLHESPPGPCYCPGTLGSRPRIHDLRHTHASWLLGAGVPITVVQARLGHKSIQTTVDTYGHLLPDAQLAAAAAADAVFGVRRPELD